MEDKDHYVCSFAQIHLGINFLSPLIRMFSSAWCGVGCISQKNLCPTFRIDREVQRAM